MRRFVLPTAGLLTLLAGAGMGCTQTPGPDLGCGAPPAPEFVCPLFPPPQVLPQQAAPETHAAERTVSLGRSVRGQELRMCVLGDGGEVTLIVGGIHGDEPTGAGLAQRFLEYLHANPAAYQGRTVAVFARANPDGLASGDRKSVV
jgi:hypothetical protein